MPIDKNLPIEEVFASLFREHYKDLRRYSIAVLRKRTGKVNPERAEEAVQEAFTIAWEKSTALLDSPSPIGWLYETLFNVLRNMIREDQRWTLRILKVQETFDLHSHASAPGSDLELEGFVSPEELDLLKRFYLNGETYQELADELGTTKTALAKRVQRIKEKFRKNYDGDRELSGSGGHVSNRGGPKR